MNRIKKLAGYLLIGYFKRLQDNAEYFTIQHYPVMANVYETIISEIHNYFHG